MRFQIEKYSGINVNLNISLFKISLFKIFIFAILLLPFSFVFSQRVKIDSLHNLLQHSKNDYHKADVLVELCYEYMYFNPDSSRLYARQAINQSLNVSRMHASDKKLYTECQRRLCNAYLAFGSTYQVIGDYTHAIEGYKKALSVATNNKNTDGEAAATGNLALIYQNQGDFTLAVKHYYNALRLYEKLHSDLGVAHQYTNLGSVYLAQKDYKKMLDVNEKALALYKKNNNALGLSTSYGSIGLCYMRMATASKLPADTAALYLQKALQNHEEALKIDVQMGNLYGVALHKNNIAATYSVSSNILPLSKPEKDALNEKAYEYYSTAIEMARGMGNSEKLCSYLGSMGVFLATRKKYAEAEKKFTEALAISKTIKAKDIEREWHLQLSDLYEVTGRYLKAASHYKAYVALHDSIRSTENTKKMARTEMQFTLDKKRTEEKTKKAEQRKKDKLKHDQEVKQQRIFMYAGVVASLVMGLFLLIAIRANRQKKKDNQLIAEQKKLVEEKQNEVIDSIHYARRIQQALLPSNRYMQRKLNELNKP